MMLIFIISSICNIYNNVLCRQRRSHNSGSAGSHFGRHEIRPPCSPSTCSLLKKNLLHISWCCEVEILSSNYESCSSKRASHAQTAETGDRDAVAVIQNFMYISHPDFVHNNNKQFELLTLCLLSPQVNKRILHLMYSFSYGVYLMKIIAITYSCVYQHFRQ